MNLLQAIAQSWAIPLWPTLGSVVTAIIYLRGWRAARMTRPQELPPWRAACFLAGLFFAWLALASPLDALDQFLLIAHMTEHLLLISVAPLLIVLGSPVVPLLRGLPRSFVRDELAPWMNSSPWHWLQNLFTNPVFAWMAMCSALLLWHAPAAYELTLRSSFWHDVEHGCFFFTALAFWWFVIQPWPVRRRHSGWISLLYVITAHLVSLGIATFLALYNSVVYPSYARVPRLFGLSALNDQGIAGGEMFIVGLWVMVIAVAALMFHLLSEGEQRKPAAASALPLSSVPRQFDLLRVPLAGAVLRARYGRLALQGVSLGAVVLIVADGLHGTPLTSMNLAGTMLWNVLRPINLLLFFVLGNLFCLACPFTLPRELARSFGLGRLPWPSWLKNKWSAAVLMLLFFWAYEQFALWDSPRATALLLLAYIAAALLVDSVFRGASFCKYVCPIGQFNFVASILSPAELGVKSPKACSHCSTRDCIRGNQKQRGCELQLYLPRKAGNLDCTLCMDCVKACPHDNIAITLQSPTRDLVRDPVRSSVRRFSSREDIALLVLVVVFAALVNAAVMIAPVARFLAALHERYSYLGSWLASLLLTCVFSAALLLLYLGLAKSLQLLSTRNELRTVFCRFAIALLPLGLAMWAAHLSFHLATSWSSLPQIAQHAYASFTGHQLGVAQSMSMMSMPAAAKSIDFVLSPLARGTDLLDLQIWMLNLGLFLAWYAGWKLIRQMTASARNAGAMLLVWATSSTAFYALCVWVLTQPMEMRGMGM